MGISSHSLLHSATCETPGVSTLSSVAHVGDTVSPRSIAITLRIYSFSLIAGIPGDSGRLIPGFRGA